MEVSLLMCWYLVEEYGFNPLITGLVNTREIWIIPMVNPDGREAHTRQNANGVDLNRDYGYMWGGYSGDEPFSQPETKVIREHALDNNFVLSLSFHTSGDIVNYIWNYKGQPVPDEDVVVMLSEQYGSYNGYWVVEGFDWYQTRGDTNDFFFVCRGDIDWTIEIQNSNINQAWDLNRPGMIDLIDAADWGLTGIVTDASTGEPLLATIWVEEIFWPSFTDPKIGDYYKPLLEGTYHVHVMANGYEEQVHEVVITNHEVPVVLDVALNPGGERYAHQVVWCNFYDPYSYPNNYQNNPTDAVFALGPPDDTFGSLGVGGDMVVDMGEDAMIINGLGDDFTVFEGDDGTSEGYHVSVSDNWEMNGVWTHIGSASGTSSFDLEGSGVEQTRYVRIQDDYGGNAYDYCPGFDVDAIQSLHTSSEIDPDLSFVTLTDDRMPGMFTCPDGDGPAYQYVKVTVKDSNGDPVVGLPADVFDFSITAGSGTFVYGTLNCTFTAVDTMTDSNGEIRFEIVADTAITGDLNTDNPGILIIEAIVDEIPLNDVDELECRSPDYVPDGDVDLSDLVLFAQDFYNYGLRSDFNWDGECNLIDFVFFAQHYGHRAISVDNFRIKRFIPSFFSLK